MPDFNYKRIAATGVTTISISNMGTLHGVVLNQQSTVAASSSLVSIYDSTTTSAGTGSLLAVIQVANAGVGDYIYDCLYTNGLTVNVPSGTTPIDLTVVFR